MYKILDCTIRDGGYVNNWHFKNEFVRELYKANLESGVDVMEIGFRRTPDADINNYGKWYYTTENLITETLGDLYDERCKLALMCQIDTFKVEDFVPRKNSLVSMVRVLWAYHSENKNDKVLNVKDFPKIKEQLNGLRDLGYDLSFNIGRVDKMSMEQISDLINFINTTPISMFYIADTYGHLDLKLTESYLKFIKDNLNPHIELGFHAHNNLNNSTAKTLLSLNYGVSIVDGTTFGYGRGSGNAFLELLISNKIQNKIDVNANIIPLLEFIDQHIVDYKTQNKFGYGYNIIFLLSGLYSMHVNYAIEIIEKTEKMSVGKVWKIFRKIIDHNHHNYYNNKLINTYLGDH